ncbi:dihydrolipoamide acetyltransferase family protein [Rhizobium sp. BR 362]|uniref:dihydrolipoamide acetyltransferase family protein n=1 Tax=Rhizobium sp. BR 362 TaxID=3040670 RepID=UPI002F420859
MSEFLIEMPDVGEGVAEAELVEWFVKVGDPVREDMVIAAVMTDKATVEIPSPVNGFVTWLAGEVGERIAVKAPLVRIDMGGDGGGARFGEVSDAPAEVTKAEIPTPAPTASVSLTSQSEKPLAAPPVRLFAKQSGVDLAEVQGTGPGGRILREDIEQFLSQGAALTMPRGGYTKKAATEEIKLSGLRRRIAEKMALSASRIPHITYVEEVDMTSLEELRTIMNANRKADHPKLTVLPFLVQAVVKAISDHPNVNATFDDDAGIVTRYDAVHMGIATQAPAGLTVPVVRHAEARDIWDCAAEMNRLAEAARSGTATREELSGSTITISSLGALGGIVSTPIINYPEVAIIGVNKIATRPVWDGIQFVPRKMMNLSSSFDHRIVDGWNAAIFVQRVRTLLETPALIFIEG